MYHHQKSSNSGSYSTGSSNEYHHRSRHYHGTSSSSNADTSGNSRLFSSYNNNSSSHYKSSVHSRLSTANNNNENNNNSSQRRSSKSRSRTEHHEERSYTPPLPPPPLKISIKNHHNSNNSNNHLNNSDYDRKNDRRDYKERSSSKSRYIEQEERLSRRGSHERNYNHNNNHHNNNHHNNNYHNDYDHYHHHHQSGPSSSQREGHYGGYERKEYQSANTSSRSSSGHRVDSKISKSDYYESTNHYHEQQQHRQYYQTNNSYPQSRQQSSSYSAQNSAACSPSNEHAMSASGLVTSPAPLPPLQAPSTTPPPPPPRSPFSTPSLKSNKPPLSSKVSLIINGGGCVINNGPSSVRAPLAVNSSTTLSSLTSALNGGMLQPTAAVNHSPLKTIIKLQHVTGDDSISGNSCLLSGSTTNGTILSSTVNSNEYDGSEVEERARNSYYKGNHKRHKSSHDDSDSSSPPPRLSMKNGSTLISNDLPKHNNNLNLAPIEIKMINPIPPPPETRDVACNTLPLAHFQTQEEEKPTIEQAQKNHASSKNKTSKPENKEKSTFLEVLSEDDASRSLVFRLVKQQLEAAKESGHLAPELSSVWSRLQTAFDLDNAHPNKTSQIFNSKRFSTKEEKLSSAVVSANQSKVSQTVCKHCKKSQSQKNSEKEDKKSPTKNAPKSTCSVSVGTDCEDIKMINDASRTFSVVKQSCIKCHPVKSENVRIQCRIDQYFARELRKMPLTSSLSLLTPRLPLPAHELLIRPDLKYSRFYRLEVCPNGGARVLHLYLDEIAHLGRECRHELAVEFMRESFREDPVNVAVYVISIVHNAAAYQPDWLEWLADKEPNLTVKAGVLGHGSDIETTNMAKYRDSVSLPNIYFKIIII